MTPATSILIRSGIIIPALFVFITCLLARPFPVFADGNAITINTTLDTTPTGSSLAGFTMNTSSFSVNFEGTIFGTGSFTKIGAGTLTIAGTSTYSGGTTVSEGTLVGNIPYNSALTVETGASYETGGASRTLSALNGSGIIVNADGLTVQSGVFSGAITGAESLTIGVGGDLTLAGTNTYSGGTRVSNAVLHIGNGGTDGSITGDIVNDGEVIFNRSDTVVFNGAISGTGFLTKDGPGTLTLNGTNTYAGATYVDDGMLVGNIANNTDLTIGLSASYATGGASRTLSKLFGNGDIVNSDGLTVQSGNFSGTISGTGSLEKIGTGDFFLEGVTNTYSGGTTVSGGTLFGGIPNNTDLTVKNGATYHTIFMPSVLSALNGSGSIVNLDGLKVQSGNFSGDITGTGSLEKTGTDTLTLSGDNTYSGITTVSDGTLEIGNGGTDGNITGDIVNNASLVFNRSNAVLYNGDISGTGSLTKDGGGILTLTGINTYGGGTRVLDGTLALSGAGVIQGPLSLFDGTTFDTGGTTVSPDRLDVHGSASWTGRLEMSGKELFFWVPSSMADGGVMLSVSETAYISGSSVNVGLEGSSSPMKTGDSLILLDAAGGLNFSSDNTPSGRLGIQGVTLIYDFGIAAEGGRIRATVLDASVNLRAKALSEGFLAGVSFLNAGADLMAGQGMSEAVDAGKAGIPGGNSLGVFGVISGDRSRYVTGSHVDMKSLTLLVGLSLGLDLAPGHLTLGIFFEYGNGSYDTYNSFVNAPAVHGNGDIDRAGGGILGRMDFNDTGPGHFFAEASFRTGRVRNEFGSSDLRDVHGLPARYESSSNWYSFHLGTGYVWNVTDSVSLEIFGKYFRTTLKGDTVRLSTGDSVKFEDSDSSRLRLGWRLAWTLNEHLTPFVGAAWEREFDGISRAYVGPYSIDSPSLRGDTGIGELGLSFRPSLSLPLTLELGVQGYVGKRKGASGSLNLKFEF